MTEADGGPMSAAVAEPGRWRRFWRWATQSFHWWLLLIPAIHFAMVQYLSINDLLIFAKSGPTKEFFEIVHPTVLACCLLVLLQGWRLTGKFSFGWMTLFIFCMLCRELHFYGSSAIMAGGSLILLFVAIRRRDERRAFFEKRWASSFYFVGLVCYMVSQMLDRNLINHVVRFVINDQSFKIVAENKIEESLEALGGFFMLLVPFFL